MHLLTQHSVFVIFHIVWLQAIHETQIITSARLIKWSPIGKMRFVLFFFFFWWEQANTNYWNTRIKFDSLNMCCQPKYSFGWAQFTLTLFSLALKVSTEWYQSLDWFIHWCNSYFQKFRTHTCLPIYKCLYYNNASKSMIIGRRELYNFISHHNIHPMLQGRLN